MLIDKFEDFKKLKPFIPLIVFITIWTILIGSTFHVFLDFSRYGTFYDTLISFLVFFSIVVGGSTTIWFYKLKNYSPLLRWMVGFSVISFFLGFFSLKWMFLFPFCLFSVYLIFKNKKGSKNDQTERLSKYLIIISTASILIHPITALVASQQEITIQPGDGDITTRFYLENWSKGSNLSSKTLKSLSENQAEIILGLTSKGSRGYQRGFRISNKTETMIHRFKAAGVRLHAWPLISREKGFWANNYNYRAYEETYKNLKNWDQNSAFETVQLDSESNLGRENIGKFVDNNLITSFVVNYDEIAFNHLSGSGKEAKRSYRDLVSKVNKKYQSSVAAYPFVFEDTLDGDTSLQSILGVSTYPPRNWKEVVPMVYRSTFFKKLKFDLGSYLVYSYSYSWKKSFGDRIKIGLSRPGHPGYEEMGSLARDVRLLDAMGFEQANIYCLNDFSNYYGTGKLDDFFKELRDQKKLEISYNSLVSYLRVFTALFDRLI